MVDAKHDIRSDLFIPAILHIIIYYLFLHFDLQLV